MKYSSMNTSQGSGRKILREKSVSLSLVTRSGFQTPLAISLYHGHGLLPLALFARSEGEGRFEDWGFEAEINIV
jgi:hypothetical protein